MALDVRLGTLGALVLVAVLVGAGVLADRALRTPANSVETKVATPEVPIVMRTPGGLLEVATVRAYERFKREDTADFWGLPLGTTTSQIQLTVTYRYHIELAREWPVDVDGQTAIVHAGPLVASLPVAFDTSTMEKYTHSGWARFNKDENLAQLERSLTPELAQRANSARYKSLALEPARQTVAEFVRRWLLTQPRWTNDPHAEVVVLFPGEQRPTHGMPSPAAAAAR
ncbi:MAG: hypothetical protein JSR18_07020 [Proteobacteria bacterium]|nr:hypothetical protein [Pseudomonadota bacterium]